MLLYLCDCLELVLSCQISGKGDWRRHADPQIHSRKSLVFMRKRQFAHILQYFCLRLRSKPKAMVGSACAWVYPETMETWYHFTSGNETEWKEQGSSEGFSLWSSHARKGGGKQIVLQTLFFFVKIKFWSTG